MEKESQKKLYRSRTDRVIAGVAGGLAHYFNLDPILVRALFVVLGIINGFGFLLYVVLMIIIPEEPGRKVEIDHKEKIKEFAQDVGEEARKLAHQAKADKHWLGGRRNVLATMIIVVGLVALLNQLLPMHWLRWDWFWPAVLIIVGLFVLLKNNK